MRNASRAPFLEAGSKDYGNTQDLRALFRGRLDADSSSDNEYLGVDMLAGPGVDIVADLSGDFAAVDASLGGRRFGTIFCLSVLEHCENPFAMAENLTRLLKPGGNICVSVPFAFRLHAYPDDFWRFTPSGVRKLFASLEFRPEDSVWTTYFEKDVSKNGDFRSINSQLGKLPFSLSAHWKTGHRLRGVVAKNAECTGKVRFSALVGRISLCAGPHRHYNDRRSHYRFQRKRIMTVLHVENVCKEYATRAEPLVVLRDISLRMESGRSLAILGPSGSGKSTLLNIIGTLEPPSSGRVLFDDENPAGLSEPKLADFRNHRIGFIFQDHHLLPQCSALENVLIPTVAGRQTSNEQVERAKMLLQRVGLGDRMEHLPGELSGGERQRTAIARALINRPGILLADEPTGNLDRRTAHDIGELLLEMQREEQAILVTVTHSQRLAELMGRRLQLDEGRLIESS